MNKNEGLADDEAWDTVRDFLAAGVVSAMAIVTLTIARCRFAVTLCVTSKSECPVPSLATAPSSL